MIARASWPAGKMHGVAWESSIEATLATRGEALESSSFETE